MSSCCPSLLLGLLLLLTIAPASSRPSSDISLASALAHGGGSQSWGLKLDDEDAMEETLR